MIELVAALAAAASECQRATPIQAAAPDTVIVYDLDGVTAFGRQVVETRSGVSTHREFIYGQRRNGDWMVGRDRGTYRTVFGAIPVSDTHAGPSGFQRNRDMKRDPVLALAGLAVGESVVLPGAETFVAPGKRPIRNDQPVKATFIGCFTEEVAGAPERILKYEIDLPGVGRRGEEDDIGPTRTIATVSISPSLSYLVSYKSQHGSFRARWIGYEIPTAPPGR